jgi:hypothetical protein
VNGQCPTKKGRETLHFSEPVPVRHMLLITQHSTTKDTLLLHSVAYTYLEVQIYLILGMLMKHATCPDERTRTKNIVFENMKT